MQSHLPCVVRGRTPRPAQHMSRQSWLCEVSHPLSSDSCLPGKGVSAQPHQKQALLEPILARPSLLTSTRTQKCPLWHQSSDMAGAANLFYFQDRLAAPEGGKYEFLSPIYQTFIIVY